MVSFINLSTYFYNLSLIRNIDSYYRKYDTSEVVKLLAKGFLGYECIKDNPDLVADLKRALEKFRSV